MFESSTGALREVDSRAAAEMAGLRYVSDATPGIRRKNSGARFSFYKPDGSKISDKAIIERIKALAIPPAWTEVWICPSAAGHLQATGRDARHRKQYKYHAEFRERREADKFQRLSNFAKALPKIRKQVDVHIALRGLPREKIMATVVNLLEVTLIRVGNEDYAKQNKSYGLTTLRNRHVTVNGTEIRFQFVGKSGKKWSLEVRDRRIAKIVKSCQDLPGQDLLQYIGEDGTVQTVTSSDVNEYLRSISGEDITAKDFRTWSGTVLAALMLNSLEKSKNITEIKRNLRNVIVSVAARLGNTPTICRKCYIHPDIMERYTQGKLALAIGLTRPSKARLSPEELAVLKLLKRRRPIEIMRL